MLLRLKHFLKPSSCGQRPKINFVRKCASCIDLRFVCVQTALGDMLDSGLVDPTAVLESLKERAKSTSAWVYGAGVPCVNGWYSASETRVAGEFVTCEKAVALDGESVKLFLFNKSHFWYISAPQVGGEVALGTDADRIFYQTRFCNLSDIWKTSALGVEPAPRMKLTRALDG